MQRRHFIALGARSVLGLVMTGMPFKMTRLLSLPTLKFGSSDALYNGIVPPTPFPPILEQPWSTDESPYYITDPPAVIRIDTGRQLFVDDFLIELMGGLERTFHEPDPFEGNPVFSPTDEKIHMRTDNDGLLIQTQLACPFSDGVWWDTRAKRFRAWYLGGPDTLRLAESSDGIEWNRVEPDGIVMSIPRERDSGSVWIDEADPDPSRRYKMSFYAFEDKRNWLYASEDGVHWPPVDEPAARSAYYSSNPDMPTGDRTTFFYNPFRQKWVWSLRDIRDRRDYGGLQYHRMRRYFEADDLFEGASILDQSGYWVEADQQDLEEAGPPGRPQLTIPQVYHVDGFAYESIMIFGLTILSSNAWTNLTTGEAFPKRNEVYLGFSRDGFYMTRAAGKDRKPFLSIGAPEAWNEGNVQTVGAGCIITGDAAFEQLRFYYSGRRNWLTGESALTRKGYLGFASLRRDGFASIDGGLTEGVLTTRPLQFDHPDGYLFVNVDTTAGRLRVEVLDQDGVVLQGFDRDDCVPFLVDSTRQMVRWEDKESLSSLSGKPFRLRFILRSGRLFSFWVAATRAGASEGFIGGGGPGYDGYRDESPPDTSAVDIDQPPSDEHITVAPNPFKTSTSIIYYQEVDGPVVVRLYDVAGRLVRVLRDATQSAGPHTLRFDRDGLAGGIYFCRVRTPRSSQTLKIVVAGSP